MPYSFLRDRSINDRFFRHVANSTYDWESWHDPVGKLVWVNEAVERFTGYTVDECHRMDEYPLPMVAEPDRPRIQRMLDQAISGGSHNDLEFSIVTRSGQMRRMAVSWQSMYGDSQQHLGFRTSVRDITDRQKLQDQLQMYTGQLEQLVEERSAQIAQLQSHRRQMEKLAALGELAAGVAHEVNNPLAGIRNAFALFRGSIPADHEYFDLLDLVDKEIERISSIIHQMYQLYRRTPQQASEVDLRRTISESICLLEPIARRHHVTLRFDPGSEPVTATLPEGEVKQVLFNIVRNAIQASRMNQDVIIGLSVNQADAVIVVTDHGAGIDEETMPHIFEPFFSTKSQLKEGMGLGLSISRNLIESMNGSIDVQSGVGQGSVFTVTIPRRVG
jgi:PAS domain S-box-containing protein